MSLYQSFQKKSRNTPLAFLAALVVSIALCFAYTFEGEKGALHSVQNAVSLGAVPAKRIGGVFGSALDATSARLDDSQANPETLSHLREQNAHLRNLVVQGEEYRQEIIRLRSLLSMKEAAKLSGVAARIIDKTLSGWERSVTINVGSAEGISPGMAVMGSSCVVGQVSAVNAHSAQVRLLQDSASGAAVMIQSTRVQGMIQGSLEGLIYVHNLTGDQMPQAGDSVITSGVGGTFPKGLLVGSVTPSHSSQLKHDERYLVTQPDNIAQLEEVFVIKEYGS